MSQFNKSPLEVQSAEHISPSKTGDNIEAKRAALYGFDTGAGQWRRVGLDADGNIAVSGTITTVDDTVSTSTDVSLASSASSAQLVAANTSRKGLLLNNTDANPVYIYYGTTATTSKFTVRIPSNSYWEMPQPVYTGRIDAIWSADGSGSLIGSEL